MAGSINVYLPVHEHLRRAREALGMTQAELGAAIGYRGSMVRAVEARERNASDEYIVGVVRLLRRQHRHAARARALLEARRGSCRICVLYGAVPEWRRPA